MLLSNDSVDFCLLALAGKRTSVPIRLVNDEAPILSTLCPISTYFETEPGTPFHTDPKFI